MSSRDSGGAFWEAEVDGVIDMGLRDPWPPDFAHYWLSEVDPLRSLARSPASVRSRRERSLDTGQFGRDMSASLHGG